MSALPADGRIREDFCEGKPDGIGDKPLYFRALSLTANHHAHRFWSDADSPRHIKALQAVEA